MNSTLFKQRLVGALILLLLLAMLLPLIFSGQGRLAELQLADIQPPLSLPDLPSFDPISEAEFEQVERLLAPPEPASETVPTETTPLAEAWSIQLGTFRDATNARRLLTQLRTAGHEAYTRESLLSDGSTATQVMVGPMRDRAQAEQRRLELAEAFGVSTIVVRFQP
jgi:DedD protein